MKTLKKQSLQLLEKLKSSDVSTTMAQMDSTTSNFSKSIMKPSPDCPDGGNWIGVDVRQEYTTDSRWSSTNKRTAYKMHGDDEYIWDTISSNMPDNLQFLLHSAGRYTEPFVFFHSDIRVDEVRFTLNDISTSYNLNNALRITSGNANRWNINSAHHILIEIVTSSVAASLLTEEGDYLEFTYWIHYYDEE